MTRKLDILNKLKPFGSPTEPIGEIINSSLDIANFLSELVGLLPEGSRDEVLSFIFSEVDLSTISISQLLDKLDEHNKLS